MRGLPAESRQTGRLEYQAHSSPRSVLRPAPPPALRTPHSHTSDTNIRHSQLTTLEVTFFTFADARLELKKMKNFKTVIKQ